MKSLIIAFQKAARIGEVADDELKAMIDHFYSVVVGKLPKKARGNLNEKPFCI